MIDTVIFDFGRVLAHYEPEEIVRKLWGEEDLSLLADTIFRSPIWDALDAGSITNGEGIAMAKEQLPPHLHAAAERILTDWMTAMPPVLGMAELVADLRASGRVSLYLLSNISEHFAERHTLFPVLSLFDRLFFSGVLKLVKPSPAIFLHLLKEVGKRGEECIFIDDNADNIRAAAALGIHTYLFDGDVAALRRALSDVLSVEL